MKEQYPTNEFGIALPPSEIWLPESNLDLSDVHNYHNHHHHWCASYFGKTAVLNTFRNLEAHQSLLPIDTHSYLHAKYDYPKPPTMSQAMNRLEQAYETGESLKIRQGGRYLIKKLSQEAMKLCIDNYMQVSGKEVW